MSDFVGVSSSSSTQSEPSNIRRRGLIAGAAAFVAAIVAKEALAPEQVAATDGSALLVGVANTSAGQTVLSSSSTAVAALRVFSNGSSTGPDNEADGIQGYTAGANNSGMLARNDDLNGVGMYGIATNGTGVAGQSVGGSSISGSSISGAGGYFSSNSGFGAFGQSGSNYGVYGVSGSNAGVFGYSSTGYGLLGAVGAGAIAGLYGATSSAGIPAFAASNFAPGGLAGSFNGKVYVSGDFVASNGAKSAAVPHPDGSHRLLYCVESPESWFEDFGEGTLVGGKADVKLDPDFAAVVDTSKLHVFLTPHDASHNLAVTARSGNSFSLQAGVSGDAVARGVKASDLSGTFTYRVVAKRKDIKGERLAKFVIPSIINNPMPKIDLPKKNGGPARHTDGPIK